MCQSIPPTHNSNRTHSAIGIPMASITTGMQSTMPTAAKTSPTTTAARQSRPGTMPGRAPLNVVVRPALVIVACSTCPMRTSRSAAQPSGRCICVQRRIVTAYAIVIDGRRGVRRDRRQSCGVPALSAPDAPPVAAGLERALGQGCGCVTQRTCRRAEEVLFIVEQDRCRVLS